MLVLAEERWGRRASPRVLNLKGGAVDTATPMGSMLFMIIAARGQMEYGIQRERAVGSITKRRYAGKDLAGRPRLITDCQIRTVRRRAQSIAQLNRDAMMDRVIRQFEDWMNAPGVPSKRVNYHHNPTEQETPFGKDIWLSRKGAIDASDGCELPDTLRGWV